MAFDDFEPRDASAPDGAEQNEDLFDFPAPAPLGSDDADVVQEPAHAAESAPASSVMHEVQASQDYDLDEDLFGFPLMDGSDIEVATTEEVPPSPVRSELEDDIDELIERANDLIEEEDLESYIEPEPVAEVPAPVEIEPAPTPVSPVAPPVAQSVAAPEQQAIPVPDTLATAPRESARLGRTGIILGALATTFAFALLGVVWNASRGMQEALSARGDSGAAELALQARVIQLEHMLGDQRDELLSAIEASTIETKELLPVNVRVEPEWFVERSLIQEAIREGRYREARKRLFALQAVVDELDVEIRDELAPTIAFLIPETYRLQAGAREGGL